MSEDYNKSELIMKILDKKKTPIHSKIAKKLIKNKNVLVTGAGGSIGSEIVKQLIELQAGDVYYLDNNEYALYKLLLNQKGHALMTDEEFILADITDREELFKIFSQLKPDMVFHAAALKHLPLLERFPLFGIKTNVLGTDNVAVACGKYGISNFINVSTDKAADPISMLGITKRLAELCTATHTNEYTGTKMASVRFGNVLGSRGSFFETLKWQIENDEAVTITDPEVARYFMTIPEAACLVIEAAALSHGGEVYVLDMGEPVKIMELVEKYISLIQATKPDITFTGLRKGEKLNEDLFHPDEKQERSPHPKIIRAKVQGVNENIREMAGKIIQKNSLQSTEYIIKETKKLLNSLEMVP